MNITRRSLFGAFTIVALSVLGLATIGIPSPAMAQEGSNEVAMQIKGYWGGTTATDPKVIGTINLVDEHGKNQKSFGVTVAQGYDPVTMGMDIFQQASMKPAIVVFGRAKEVSALFGAADKQPVTIVGVYWQNSGDLILGSVKTDAAAPAKAPK